MIDELKLLQGSDYILNDKIIIHHPKLIEIANTGERAYYSMVSTLCATPSDYKSILYDNFEIDYEQVGEFEFFLMMWASLAEMNTKILLPNIENSKFKLAQHQETNNVGLYDEDDDIFIDEKTYLDLVEYVRKMHGMEKHVDIAGNETTKKYLIRKARKELQNNKQYKSTLAPLVSSMVNCAEFKYNHETVWNLNIYQFMDSVKRIQKIKNVDHIMQGIYTGNVDQKKISKDTLDWLSSM